MQFSFFFNKGKAGVKCDNIDHPVQCAFFHRIGQKIMKKALFITEFIFLLFSLIFLGCGRDEGPIPEFESIIPVTFSIDIPDALSMDESTLKNAEETDTLPGHLMYRYLRNFINLIIRRVTKYFFVKL